MKKIKQILAALLTATLITSVPAAAYASESGQFDGTRWTALNSLETMCENTALDEPALIVFTHGDADTCATADPMEKVILNRRKLDSTAIPRTHITPAEITPSPTEFDAASMRFPTVVQTPDIALYSGDDINAPSMMAPKLQCQPTELYSDTGSMSWTSMHL